MRNHSATAAAIVLFLLFLVGAANQASAQTMTNDLVKRYETGDPSAGTFIEALGEGITWGNWAAQRKSQPLFCPPQRLELTADQYFQIMKQHAKRQPPTTDLVAGYALLEGLKYTFPCSNQQ